jgi:hypothetical protein
MTTSTLNGGYDGGFGRRQRRVWGGQRAECDERASCQRSHITCHVNIDNMTLLLWISNHYFLPLVFLIDLQCHNKWVLRHRGVTTMHMRKA